MAWILAVVTGVVFVELYRRMLAGVVGVVPARTHFSGWQGLGISDGSDRRVFLVFTIAFVGLLYLAWPVAVAWLVVVLLCMEVVRRRHNAEVPTG